MRLGLGGSGDIYICFIFLAANWCKMVDSGDVGVNVKPCGHRGGGGGGDRATPSNQTP